MASSEPTTSIELLDKVIEQAPKDDSRLRNYLFALRGTLKGEEKDREESQKLLSEYEEAYKKLTSPANRIGVFLKWIEEKLALIAVGDTEFVAEVDPNVEKGGLATGTRVKVNEAYAVVGTVEEASGGPLVPVSEALEDGRLRLGGDTPGAGSRLVMRASGLQERKVESGDEVRLESTGRVAVEHFGRKESRDYFFEDVPEISWDQVGGQEHAIQLIRDTIEQPLLHPEIYCRFERSRSKGSCCTGPPGCGKTLIGKATAYNLTKEYSERVGHEVKEYFMYISGPKILNMWLGETERMVRDIFRTAREKAKEGRLVFIFMDEAELVLRTRSSGRWLNISNTVVPQFCAELDGLVSLENVVLILTSNRPDYIDPAVLRPERIDRKVKVSRPDKAATRQILGIYLHADLPLEPSALERFDGNAECARRELIESTTEHIWRKSKETEFLKVFLKNGGTETLYRKDLISGALLKSVVDRAKDEAIRRAIADPSVATGLTVGELEAAVDAEYKESEIFPKSDTQEDWLKLIDYDPENVASVKPVVSHRGEELARKTVI